MRATNIGPWKGNTVAHDALRDLQALVWNPAGLACADVQAERESADYCAHSLTIAGRRSVFRSAKTTPTKAGQFLTLWQRSADGPIRPFDTNDGVALFLVQAGFGAGLGLFVFPASAMVRHGVVSVDGTGGKRAMRVYPPDVEVGSAQARRTQKWQGDYFLAASGLDAVRARALHAD